MRSSLRKGGVGRRSKGWGGGGAELRTNLLLPNIHEAVGR